MTRTMRTASVIAALLFASAVSGQDPAQMAKVPPSTRAELQTDLMAKKLQLSPEERTKVEAINLKYANQMQPVLESGSGGFALMREVRRVEEAKDGELKAALTPAQYQTYLGMKDDLRDRLRQKALEVAGEKGQP